MRRKNLKGLMAAGLLAIAALAWLNQPAIGQAYRITVSIISQADTAVPISINGGSQGTRIGNSTTAGTPYTQIVTYKQTLNPTAITRTTALVSSGVLASITQTFTVTGLSTSDQVFISGPAPTKACPHTGFAQASATNTVRVTFAYLTGLTCTPATGLYTITAFRTLP